MDELPGNKRAPLSVFISYAHEDEPLRQRLGVHLSLLRRQGLIADWHHRQILAGEEWARQIDEHLEVASIILLLISPDFLASDYCYNVELQRALERHECGEARVVPILLRPCDWHTASLAHIQCLPRDGTPVTKWENQDAAFHEITREIRRAIEQMCGIPPGRQSSPASSVSRTHRQRLIRQMRTDWISGVLEQSLYRDMLMTLGLWEQPDALVNPWHLTIQEMDQSAHPLPAGTRILQVYDDADGRLLILGEPGAGKTTLLLELARDLLERAEEEQDHPVPIVFTLSSWAPKRQALETWLTEELHTRYRLSRKVATSWVNDDQAIILLDGLDEVAPEARSECVKAINAYQQAHDLVSIVVCSRSVEYFAQEKRLLLHQAVMIQPLTSEQIEAYLSRAGNQLQAVRQMLLDDLWLRELATTPLMLSILILAYHEKSVEDFPAAVPLSPTRFEQDVIELRAAYSSLLDAKPTTQEAHQALTAVQNASEQLLLVGRFAARRRHLFVTYTERMLHRRRLGAYTPQQTIRWLSWLAKTMILNDQMIFSVRMRLKKLPNSPSWIYRLLGRLVWLLLSGLVFGLLGGLANWLFLLQYGVEFGFGLADWLPVWLVGGLVVGLPIWLVSGRGRGLVVGLLGGLFSWLVGGLVGVLVVEPLGGLFSTLADGWVAGGLVGGLVGGLFFGLVSGLVSFRRDYRINDLALQWYLRRAGVLPWNYRRFLDHATERILLRKVGQSYIFIHRLLLDYFASLEIPSSKKRSQD